MMSGKNKKEITEKQALSKLEILCSQAEHCSFEMSEKMKRWGISEEAQARIIATLIKNRYIDDERFARAYASDKIEYNKWGRRKVDQSLFMKHIDEDIRRRVLDEFECTDYQKNLRPLLMAKIKSTKAKSDYELSCKLIRFAMGRGFDYEDIKECLSDILTEMDEEPFE